MISTMLERISKIKQEEVAPTLAKVLAAVDIKTPQGVDPTLYRDALIAALQKRMAEPQDPYTLTRGTPYQTKIKETCTLCGGTWGSPNNRVGTEECRCVLQNRLIGRVVRIHPRLETCPRFPIRTQGKLTEELVDLRDVCIRGQEDLLWASLWQAFACVPTSNAYNSRILTDSDLADAVAIKPFNRKGNEEAPAGLRELVGDPQLLIIVTGYLVDPIKKDPIQQALLDRRAKGRPSWVYLHDSRPPKLTSAALKLVNSFHPISL